MVGPGQEPPSGSLGHGFPQATTGPGVGGHTSQEYLTPAADEGKKNQTSLPSLIKENHEERNLMRSTSTRLTAPKAPRRESFMMAKRVSGVHPPPKPSTVSAKPSSCSPW
jgi:hypothetical protein